MRFGIQREGWNAWGQFSGVLNPRFLKAMLPFGALLIPLASGWCVLATKSMCESKGEPILWLSGPCFIHGMTIAFSDGMKQSTKNNDGTLRVLLIDETFERAALLKHALQEAGCRIAAHVSSSADLSGLVSELKPDVIILDTESPDRDTLEHLCIISRDQPRPIVMFTHDDDSEKIRAAIRAGVSTYVVDGLRSEKLRSIMEVAIASFNEFQAMRRSLEKAESQLAERKDIDRAKGLLMKQRGWNEEEAYQALRKMAMDKGTRLGEVARQVVSVMELLG